MRREPQRPVAPEQPAPLGGSTPPIWSPPPEATPDRDEGTGPRRRAGNPWPSTAAFGPNGLEIGGVAAEELAARYGTPLLVVDEEDLRARCRALRSQFPRVLYAVKAFTSHAVIRIAVKEGIDLLVATEGELDACLRAGVAGHHVVLHGNNKSDRELELAVSAGCGFVIVDNAEELERLDRIARARGLVQPVLIRIIPEVEAGTHPAVETGAVGSKFGTPLERAPDVVRLAHSLPGVRYEGLHAHIGSQVLRPEPYVEAVDTLLDLLAELERSAGVRTGVIDIGGGFGVTYTKEEPLALSALASRVLGRVLVASEQRALSPPSLIVEPGRSLIANAVVTLYRVGSIKREGGQGPLLAVDGGMSDNIRPMLYGARFTVASAGTPLKDPSTRFTIVGKHCESGDVLAQDAELPADIAPGGLVAFAATGAYTYSMASNYNRIGRPAVAAVRLGGSELWLRREDATDMDRLETAVVHSDPTHPHPTGCRRSSGQASGCRVVPRDVARGGGGAALRAERGCATAGEVLPAPLQAILERRPGAARRRRGSSGGWARLGAARGASRRSARRHARHRGLSRSSRRRGRLCAARRGAAMGAKRRRGEGRALRLSRQHGRGGPLPQVRVRRGGAPGPSVAQVLRLRGRDPHGALDRERHTGRRGASGRRPGPDAPRTGRRVPAWLASPWLGGAVVTHPTWICWCG